MPVKKTFLLGVGCAVAAGAAILWYMMLFQPSLITRSALRHIKHTNKSQVDTSHLADGLVPPTNKWFSGLALQKNPSTVFPTPLSVKVTNSSFSYGQPTIVPTANVVVGGMAENVTVQVDGATSYRVTRYDELSVDLTYRGANGQAVGTLTLMAGSPYVQFYSHSAARLQLTSTLGTPQQKGSTATYASSKGTYVLAGFDGAQPAGTTGFSTTKGSLLTMYVAPAGNSDTLRRSAGNRLLGGKVTYHTAGQQYRTTISIKTANGQPTLYALLPHQTNTDRSLFSYATLYGQQRLYRTNNISFTTPRIGVQDQLRLNDLSAANTKLLKTTLRHDIANTTYTAGDTYYSGKELYRSAQLLQLAKQLGDTASADAVQAKLKTQLNLWLSSTQARSDHYFYFDDQLQTVVGMQPSFDSQNNNDHHFHYGYFIYAASILAQYDADFLQHNKQVVDLLVADIANYRTGEALPQRRMFDPYFGHSWASGYAPFNDGNNQESSSEAINAWVGTSLWASVTNNRALAAESGWMLSNETATAKAYYLDINTAKAPFNGVYTHSLVSLNWSGKREYGTFFSGEPIAKLGIQLIPFSPTQAQVLSSSPNRSKQIAEAIHGTYSLAFGDYILMYNTDLPQEQRLKIAKSLPDSAIDSADSRSYMYALLLSQQ